MEKHPLYLILMVFAFIVAGLGGEAYAKNSYMTTFNSTYGTAPATIKNCTLCHPNNSTSQLNSYASAYKKAAYNYKSIEPLDSDADGATNITEINAGTYPGLATSKPAVTLTGLSISGPTTLNENNAATYVATATMSDNSSKTVSATWSENTDFTSIDFTGALTATEVFSNQIVTVSASYTEGGITSTANYLVTIVDLSVSVDTDGDGLIDSGDNCPLIANPTQSDVDNDNIGDACDTGDTDGDGLADYLDTQPSVYQTPLDDDTAFVRQIYLDFLSREPDVDGLIYWSDQLSAGALARSAVVEQYLLSPEFQGNIAPVARLYFAYFNRLPDYSGLMYWVNEYSRGNRSLDSISDLFASSSEFQATYGNLSNGEFVSLTYQNVLERAPDSDGFVYWVNELDAGNRTRGQIMTGLSESAEYQGLMANPVYVTMTYIGLLRRSPEVDGYYYWVARMDNGNSGQELIGQFINSPEYARRFQP